jgi:hypothetical protein
MNDIERDDQLIAVAGGLSTEISPERDLWPEIAGAIAKPARARWTPMLAQAAAVVLLIGASSGITYLAVKEEPQLVPVVMQDLRFEQAAFGAEHTLGSVYRSAQGDYQSQLKEQLDRLPAETRAEIERNLTLIRNAIAEINVALKENPDNAHLQELLVSSYREQHALMRRVGALTQHVMARKDI